MYEFDVVILEDEKEGYIAFVPALPAVILKEKLSRN